MAKREIGTSSTGEVDKPGRKARNSGGPYRSDAHAVVIGINIYQDEAISNLKYANADAQAIYDVLVDPELGRFNPKNVQLLLDGDATAEAIKTAIATDLPRKAQEEDTVFIYYAGHGAPVINPGTQSRDGFEKYLVPTNAQMDNLRATGIPMTDIQKYFGFIHSQQVLFFIDSCYSGAVGGRTFSQDDYGARAVLTDEFLDQLGGSGRCVVTACGINEVSLESKIIGHGLFTYYLVEGLKGAADINGDGRVTIRELYDYVYENVKRKSRSLNGNMKPGFKGSVEGRIYLTQYLSDELISAKELAKAARSHYEAGNLDKADRAWRELLDLDPEHDDAQRGLEALEKELQEQQVIRKSRIKVLMGLHQSGKLPLSEYNRALVLLKKNPGEMTAHEAAVWSYLEPLCEGEMPVSVYLTTIANLSELEEQASSEIKSSEQESVPKQETGHNRHQRPHGKIQEPKDTNVPEPEVLPVKHVKSWQVIAAGIVLATLVGWWLYEPDVEPDVDPVLPPAVDDPIVPEPIKPPSESEQDLDRNLPVTPTDIDKVPDNEEEVLSYALTIDPDPEDARVKVLNIGPRYESGMMLKPGRYQVQVSKPGYESKTLWLELTDHNLTQEITLYPEIAKVIEPVPVPMPVPVEPLGNINIRYNGDTGNCAVNIVIYLENTNRMITPTGNLFPVYNVSLADNYYTISGTIVCPLWGSSCTAFGEDDITFLDGHTFDIRWEDAGFGQCDIALMHFPH